MATVEPLLLQLASDVQPSQARERRAVGSHNRLRDLLRTGHFRSRVIDDYLSGSYSRRTAIDPLDDVDIIFVIDPTKWQDGLSRFLNIKPDPQAVLGAFASAIRRRYEQSSVRTQRRSVRLQLQHLNLDIVPAIDADSQGMIWIPDRQAKEWIRSAPKHHRAHGEQLNERHGGRFKPLVRILKYWNSRLPETARLKSFTIETMATRIFRSHSFSSLEEGFFKFLDYSVWLLGGKPLNPRWSDRCGMSFSWGKLDIPDIARTGSNVAAGVDSHRANRFAACARVSRDRIREAFDAATLAGAATKLQSALRA